MKIKFILAKILHNWSTNLDQNILNKLGYYQIISWYNNGNKSIISDCETVIEKLSTIYSNLIENGLGNSHLSRLVNNKIQEVEKELEKLKTTISLSSDQILQNALDKGKFAHEEYLKDKQKRLEQIHINFLKAFQHSAFDEEFKFEFDCFVGSLASLNEIERYLKKNVDFLSKCIFTIEYSKNSGSYFIIKLIYKG